MIYCDTSLLIAALTLEVRSHMAQPWLLAQTRSSLVVSDWSVTKFVKAIARKQHRRDLHPDHRVVAEGAWNSLRTEFTHVAATTAHFVRAAGLADAVPNGPCAGDTLHLAMVLDEQGNLATLDRDLADAARAMGVAVHPGP